MEYQKVGGAVILPPSSWASPRVEYTYSEMDGGANHSRLESITYPSGYVLTHNYASGLNDDISRLTSLSDSGVTLESYDYLSLGTVVQRSHPQPGVDLTYIGSPGDAGDQYAGLDRFGRIIDQRWTDGTTDVDRYQYGYDRAGNRTYRENAVNSALSEVYSYDGLNQLTGFERGTLNGSKDGITGTVARSQEWDYDALGNWNSVTTDGGSPNRPVPIVHTASRPRETKGIQPARQDVECHTVRVRQPFTMVATVASRRGIIGQRIPLIQNQHAASSRRVAVVMFEQPAESLAALDLPRWELQDGRIIGVGHGVVSSVITILAFRLYGHCQRHATAGGVRAFHVIGSR